MCLALGWPHPDFLLELLTGEQLAGWQDYASREPFGFPAEDMRAAMAMTVAANVGGSKLEPADFSMAARIGEAEEAALEPEDALARQLQRLIPARPAPAPAAPEE